MTPRRRFLNLVVWSWRDGLYSLRRIDPCKSLFYESAEQAQQAAAEKTRKKFDKTFTRLPGPIVSFDPSPTGNTFAGLEWFELFGGEGRIVNSNRAGEMVMYDADRNVVLTLPGLHQPKGRNPVAVSVAHPGADEDCLYLMDRCPGRHVTRPRLAPWPDADRHYPRSCFEVLEYARGNSDRSHSRGGWRCRPLPPPPCVHLPGYDPSSLITSYTTMDTADGCTSIVVSSSVKSFGGTYCFDTATVRPDPSHHQELNESDGQVWRSLDEWRHVGDWALPFHGRAEHVRELNTWLGFKDSAPPYRQSHLCAVDLAAAVEHGGPPTLQHVWEDLALPEEGERGRLYTRHLRLVNLGGGRFCVAKLFEDLGKGQDGSWFAVLTGVELLRDEQDHSRLRIVRHKRARYASNRNAICWVL